MRCLHSIKYTFLALMRDRETVFWCLAFPIVLSTIFQFAFGNLAEGEQFSTIPVAVVQNGFEEAQNLIDSGLDNTNAVQISLLDMIDDISVSDDMSFLDVTYTSKEEAYRLLEEKKVYGIYELDFSDLHQPLRLTLSGEMNSDPLFQSILKTFTDHMNAMTYAIYESIETNPENAQEVLAGLSGDMNYFVTENLGIGEYDTMLNYFFNLLSMTCLYGALTGLTVGIRNQANMQPVAMRKCIAPSNPFIVLLGDLIATYFFEFICAVVALLYCTLVLKVNFGVQYGYLLFTCFIGSSAGVNLGFLVSSIGTKSKEQKTGILFLITMIPCILSGMMYVGMRIIIEQTVPFINKINLSALLCDAFYSLIVYPSHERYWMNASMIMAISAGMLLLGLSLVRRKKYAAL